MLTEERISELWLLYTPASKGQFLGMERFARAVEREARRETLEELARRKRAGAAHMSETDRATLLHAAELLEQDADVCVWELENTLERESYLRPRMDDLIATARALREMASDTSQS